MFKYCIKLTKLTAPDTLEKIGTNVFKEYNKKLKVTVPEGSLMDSYIREYYRGLKLEPAKKK